MARQVGRRCRRAGRTASDTLDAGVLEFSADGKTFSEPAKFADGEARAEAKGKEVLAVRVRPAAGQSHPLAVREFAVDSDPPVATFAYPVEFVVDVSDAPEMKGWAEEVARLCERWYPRLNEELKSDGLQARPPRHDDPVEATTTGWRRRTRAAGSSAR